MAKKFYAVVNGADVNPSVYSDWDIAKSKIEHISNVKYKSFTKLEDAVSFIEKSGFKKEDIIYTLDSEKYKNNYYKNEKNDKIEENDFKTDNFKNFNSKETLDGLVCYVDGSFDASRKIYSYGLAIIKDGEILHEFNGTGSNPQYVNMRNVAGEILGSVKAVEFANKNGFRKIHIFFDYQGIESWAKGTWKRNNDLTKGYHEYIKSFEGKIKIVFHKVAGHSGDKFNDLADKLARAALNKD